VGLSLSQLIHENQPDKIYDLTSIIQKLHFYFSLLGEELKNQTLLFRHLAVNEKLVRFNDCEESGTKEKAILFAKEMRRFLADWAIVLLESAFAITSGVLSNKRIA
jgi:hypothetical protein